MGGGGRTCVYMLCGVSPKKPLAACSCKYMAWSMTVMQLFMLPISSRTVGWSVAKRHSLSTINLYWYVPARAQSLWRRPAGQGRSGKSYGTALAPRCADGLPGGRFKQTTWSVPLRRSGMRSSQALNDPVTNTALPPADHCSTVGTGSASPDGSCSSADEGPAPLHPGAPEENSVREGSRAEVGGHMGRALFTGVPAAVGLYCWSLCGPLCVCPMVPRRPRRFTKIRERRLGFCPESVGTGCLGHKCPCFVWTCPSADIFLLPLQGLLLLPTCSLRVTAHV